MAAASTHSEYVIRLLNSNYGDIRMPQCYMYTTIFILPETFCTCLRNEFHESAHDYLSNICKCNEETVVSKTKCKTQYTKLIPV